MYDFKLAIFDLDGVITETSKQHYLAWKKLAEELDIEIDLEFNETLKGVSRMDSLERILAIGNKQDDYSSEEKIKLATKKNDNYVQMISKFKRTDLFDGIYDLLISLKNAGVKIALGSASKNGPRLLKSMAIEELFDYVVNPAEVPGKPNPDIFLKAAHELNISPEFCIGFEDAFSGVKAIKSANMFAVGVGNQDILREADIVYGKPKQIDLREINELYKKR